MDKIMNFLDSFKIEDMEKFKEEMFEKAQNNPENLSNWFFKIKTSLEETNSAIQVPETVVIKLDKEHYDWLNSDSYKDEDVVNFDAFLKDNIKEFAKKHPKMFMKTGVFSNKFEFEKTQVDMGTDIGKKCLSIYYTSMVYGVESTNEIVFREMIQSTPDVKRIYGGMPLNTEFRVFYDFDTQSVLGVSNYWHPEVMKTNLQEEDLATYLSWESKLIEEFDQNKNAVIEEVKQGLKNTNGLKGKWSVDIMLAGSDFWLIDMARMEKSALVKHMENSF